MVAKWDRTERVTNFIKQLYVVYIVHNIDEVRGEEQWYVVYIVQKNWYSHKQE